MLLLLDEAASGVWNMSVDEALLAWAAESGQGAVRLYSWSEPTLSLGYFQSIADRSAHAASLACSVVRRASGGGAILHDREITYSMVVPHQARWSRAASAWVDTIHDAWIRVLALQNLSARKYGGCGAAEGREDPFLCFARRACGDLVVDDVKILGSAQRRWQGAILQHGSLLCARSRWAPELAGLAEVSGVALDQDRLRRDWIAEVQRSGEFVWSGAELPAEVARAAAEIAREKYGNLAWTAKR